MENKNFEAFNKARKSKHINAVLLINSVLEGSIIRICIEERNKYTNERESIFVEYPINKVIFQGYSNNKPTKLEQTKRIVFHESFYNYDSHIGTILKAIKEKSELTLKIVAFNSNENLEAANFVQHSAYLIVDNNTYLFKNFVGLDNSASPINY